MPKKKPKKPTPAPKAPSEMTSEEALDHLFHPEIAKKAREHVAESEDRSIKDH
jgi:hypothetical protein